MTDRDTWFDNPNMQAAALEAANPIAQAYAQGYQTGQHDGTSLLTAIFHLMDATDHRFDYDRPLNDQVHECADTIRNTRQAWLTLTAAHANRVTELGEAARAHAAKIQGKDDVIEELRKQVEGRDRTIDRLQRKLAEVEARYYTGLDLGDDPDGDLEGADYPPFPAGTP